MHLCYLCGEYPPASHGGIGTFTRIMALAMAARGHTVTVVGVQPGLDASVQEQDGPVRVIRLAAGGGGPVGVLHDAMAINRTLASVHAAQPIDVLEGQEGALAFVRVPPQLARLVRLHGGHHFFAHLEARPRRALRGWAERRSLQRATHLCAVSAYVAQTTQSLIPALRGRAVEILHNPVDLERFSPALPQDEVPGLVLFVGTVCEKKGVRVLLDAFAQLLPQFPTARLELVGRDGRDHVSGGSYITSVQAHIPALVRDRVHFVGAVPHHEVAQYLARASVCVFPATAEAFGLATLEAMARGKACVVSDVGPGPELVQHNESGLLVSPRDATAMAQAILALLRNDEQRHALGAAARERAASHFALTHSVVANEVYYQRCISEQRAR